MSRDKTSGLSVWLLSLWVGFIGLGTRRIQLEIQDFVFRNWVASQWYDWGFCVDGDKGTGLTQKWVTVIVSQTKRTGGRGTQTPLVFQTLGSLIQRNRDIHPYRWSWGSKHGEIKNSGVTDNSHQYSQSSGGRSWVIFREIAGSRWQNLPSSKGQPSVCCSHGSSDCFCFAFTFKFSHDSLSLAECCS